MTCGVSLAMTTAGCSVSFSYGYVLITSLFFIHTKNEMAMKCRFHSTLLLSSETYCAPTNTKKVWAGTQAGLLVKLLLQSPAYLKENCNGSTVFHKFSSTKFQICSTAITLLRAYTWTDEAVLPGPPQTCQCT